MICLLQMSLFQASEKYFIPDILMEDNLLNQICAKLDSIICELSYRKVYTEQRLRAIIFVASRHLSLRHYIHGRYSNKLAYIEARYCRCMPIFKMVRQERERVLRLVSQMHEESFREIMQVERRFYETFGMEPHHSEVIELDADSSSLQTVHKESLKESQYLPPSVFCIVRVFGISVSNGRVYNELQMVSLVEDDSMEPEIEYKLDDSFEQVLQQDGREMDLLSLGSLIIPLASAEQEIIRVDESESVEIVEKP